LINVVHITIAYYINFAYYQLEGVRRCGEDILTTADICWYRWPSQNIWKRSLRFKIDGRL